MNITDFMWRLFAYLSDHPTHFEMRYFPHNFCLELYDQDCDKVLQIMPLTFWLNDGVTHSIIRTQVRGDLSGKCNWPKNCHNLRSLALIIEEFLR